MLYVRRNYIWWHDRWQQSPKISKTSSATRVGCSGWDWREPFLSHPFLELAEKNDEMDMDKKCSFIDGSQRVTLVIAFAFPFWKGGGNLRMKFRL